MVTSAVEQDGSANAVFPQACTACSAEEDELIVASGVGTPSADDWSKQQDDPVPCNLSVEELKSLLSEHSRRIGELERLLEDKPSSGRRASAAQRSRDRPTPLATAEDRRPQQSSAFSPTRSTASRRQADAVQATEPHEGMRKAPASGDEVISPTKVRDRATSGMAPSPSGANLGVQSRPSGMEARPTPSQVAAGDLNVFNGGSDVNMKLFDQDQLKAIYDKPYKKARQQAALFGGGFLGILSMPFGPIGMAAGGMFGGLVGAAVGYLIDRRTANSHLHDSEREKKRLKSLVRWATSRSHDDEEILRLLEVVTLEFKPIADIAAGSKNARKMLKQLDRWISQKSVTRQLWVYMDRLLSQWRNLNRADFLRSMRVFQILSTMYKHTQRVLDDHEEQFMQRMERLLNHDSVKSVMAHAQLHPTLGERQVMECMVFADAVKKTRFRSNSQSIKEIPMRSPSNASNSPGTGDVEIAELSDDSEDEVPTYAANGQNGGLLLSPQGVAGAPSVREPDLGEPSPSLRAKSMILKRPFFKNWEDFMDFDVTFKHQMPITLSEFDLLLQKETESNKGWDVCVDRKEIKVSKMAFGSCSITLRAWTTIPEVDMKVAFYLFYQFSERVKWDKVFAKMELLPAENGSDVLYSLMKVPAVTPRDFLQYRRVRVMEDGTILIVLRSAEHPDMPEQKGIIRAESYISGYVLRQVYEDGVKVLKIFLMSCSDVKGLIPKWIVNYVAPKKPAEWVETLKKACLDYQAANPNYHEAMNEYLQQFMKPNPFDYEPEGTTVVPTPERSLSQEAVERSTKQVQIEEDVEQDSWGRKAQL